VSLSFSLGSAKLKLCLLEVERDCLRMKFRPKRAVSLSDELTDVLSESDDDSDVGSESYSDFDC
jgi:hypothetical protein